MPQGENFWNPYRLIPIREEIRRRPPLTDEKFKEKSGIIYCSLENLTPLFIGGSRDFKSNFLTRNGKYVIPGSSLKGMLRSLAEIIGGGCFITNPRGPYPAKYKACQKSEDLCITCRMFGMIGRGEVHRGNVSIGDAIIREERTETQRFEILLSSCGTRHEPFYRSEQTGKLDGKSRKLYFHQPNRTDSVPSVPDMLRTRAWHINALLPGHHFDFEVQFSNLTQDELSLLVYVLALEENVSVTIGEEKITLQGPLRHKIGNAKPLGMGSCHISITKMIYLPDAKTRFRSLVQARDTVYEGDALKKELSALTQNIVSDTSPTMQQLRKMMIWNEKDTREFKYPDHNWFKNPANSREILKKI